MLTPAVKNLDMMSAVQQAARNLVLLRLVLLRLVLLMGLMLFAAPQVFSQEAEYVLGTGDVIRVTVFQNPDMTAEVRVSESGYARLPLIGAVRISGVSLSSAETLIESRLRSGNFVQRPQVSILPLQIRASQAAVLGHVNRPGRYPLETATMRLSDLLASAGGIAPTGADSIVLSGKRNGQPMRRKIDVPSLFIDGSAADEIIMPGDIIYVNRAPVFYIYGQVQRPGVLRLERRMTVMQALAAGGGLTGRGTDSGLRIHRRDASGKIKNIEPAPDDELLPDDVIYVRESLF